MSDSCNPMDCSPSGSSAHGILQARILEWDAISFSTGSSNPGIKPESPVFQAVSCIASEFFTAEPPGSKILTAEMQDGDEVTQHHLWEINQGL